MRGGEPVARPKGAPTPCHSCPKFPRGFLDRRPENASQFELSAKNLQALAYYYQARACGGNVPLDDCSREVLGVIDMIVRRHEQSEAIQAGLLPLMQSLLLKKVL